MTDKKDEENKAWAEKKVQILHGFDFYQQPARSPRTATPKSWNSIKPSKKAGKTLILYRTVPSSESNKNRKARNSLKNKRMRAKTHMKNAVGGGVEPPRGS